METILLVHGYSSEGKDKDVRQIYGQLPDLLQNAFGKHKVVELDLSRWLSLEDGITLNDVSFAMDRALNKEFSQLLASGFHVIIHSTGALVVRNWLQRFSPKPSPIKNLIHLAGANFGSGLAHIGKGQLARWGRFIFMATEPGIQILNELEFGSWKTIDLHKHFLQPGNDMYKDYQVQEFCLVGSQSFSGLLKTVIRAIPIRYVKEDSADNTVRTCSCNLNFNYIEVKPSRRCYQFTASYIQRQLNKREADKHIAASFYTINLEHLADSRPQIPFVLLYETAHFGDDIGIVDGQKNRRQIMRYVKAALKTKPGLSNYEKTAQYFAEGTQRTLRKVSKLKAGLFNWNRQQQYEGHAQIIFRIRDQFGNVIPDHDITFRSKPEKNKTQYALERMIEDKHNNSKYPGTLTFYLRTTEYKRRAWRNKTADIAPLYVEITAYEPESSDICYVPLNLQLNTGDLSRIVHTFSTTIIDITLLRLPSDEVFSVESF